MLHRTALSGRSLHVSSKTPLKYDADIDLSNRNESHTLMIELVGEKRAVLDLGCATGALGQALKGRGCRVTGVEIDVEAAAVARQVLDDVEVADLEDPSLFDRFEDGSFDAVIFGDVLEHLRDSSAVLARSQRLLSKDGFVVLSIPNIAHGAVRLALLAGRFEYQPVGLLDETHLRFFTRSSLKVLLADAGFRAVQVLRTRCGIFDSELPLNRAEFPPELIQAVEMAEEADTYQFVIKAVPESSPVSAPDPWDDEPDEAGLDHSPWFEGRRLAASLVRSVAHMSASLAPRVATAPQQIPDYVYVYSLDAAQDRDSYQVWLEANAGRRAEEVRRTREALAARTDVPSISVVVPVYRPDHHLMRRCVASVVDQDFDRWQLCLCDDGSEDPALTVLLAELASLDPRISVASRDENGGISAATNTAASLADGEFLAFLDQDDELGPGALARVALALVENPEVDVLYTDEDKFEPDGTRSEPFFKPDWSPDQLLSHMYIGHLFVLRRTLFEELGGLRPAFDGSQDYDLALRATERARKVAHVATVAYHWRKIAGSTAQDYRAKPKSDIAARAALTDALARRGERGVVESGLHEGTFRVRREIQGSPLISVIIPFHDGAAFLRRCVESLQRSGYQNWEAILVDNRSWQPETRAVLSRLRQDQRCRVLQFSEDFNWAAVNNFASRHALGEHLLFMNVDVEGRSPGWLTAMLEHSQRAEVGAVGARLVYPDGRVQHAGVVMGLGGGVAWHAFCFCPGDQPGYFGQSKLVRNYSALTGACMMVRRETFDALGGFDESLPVAYNDIDFCLRLRAFGYQLVYTPFAELVHEESAVRGQASREPMETAAMFERWESVIRRDPYFNPNLDPRRSEHALSAGVEEVDPWESLVSSVESWLKRSGAR
jgi:GT2 family glycosyltransferase/2-polyprenyl-3-methyl-5-hydroxy-6-metoxy-1,4-benzoquinol methylase